MKDRPDPGGVVCYQLRFPSVEYPNAELFARQLAAWMREIGCGDVDSSVGKRFSEPTASSIDDIGDDYGVRCGTSAR
jgi:hypothetical protein